MNPHPATKATPKRNIITTTLSGENRPNPNVS